MIIRREFSRFTVFVIKKNSRVVKRNGIYAVRASRRFRDKRDEISANMARRSTGISKGVVRNLILPSIMVRTPKRIANMLTEADRRICLGRINASVFMLKKSRGRRSRVSPMIKRLVFSMYKIVCFL